MPTNKGYKKTKSKHPREREAERKKELEKLAKDELKNQIDEYKNLNHKELIERENKQIEDLKKSPKLLIHTIEEIQKEVAGEEDTITALIIIATSRLVENAIPESTNLLLSDKTGLGKDWITKKTLEVIIPPEQHLHLTKMSNEAFTYWHYNDQDWTWDNKVIHFEDITGDLLNTSTFKTMASGENIAVVVKKQKTLEIPIPGKPCMILTSHHANPEDEGLRRFRIGALNEDVDQTKKIKDKISKRYTKENIEESNDILRKVIQNLKSYSVVIPYAVLIQHFFPDTTLMRTHYHCFLDYICSSAVFHQNLREKTKDGELIATPDDYMIARLVLIYTTSNPLMIPTSKEYRDIIKILKTNGSALAVKEIEIKSDKSGSWLYDHLNRMVELGLLKKGSIQKEAGSVTKNVTTYDLPLVFNANTIPTWNQILKIINKITKKTRKTRNTIIESIEENDIEKWFSSYIGKPRKPEELEIFSVFQKQIKPSNREVFLVFQVLSDFLCNKNNERYKKYYIETEISKEIKQESLDQVNDFRKIQEFCNSANDNGGFIHEKSLIAFIKHKLGKADPENYYQHLLQNTILTFYPGKGLKFTGGMN